MKYNSEETSGELEKLKKEVRYDKKLWANSTG